MNGMVDGTCDEHMKWNEYIWALTPKLLDMGESDFLKQSPKNVEKLRATLDAKFEYKGNKITDKAFERMIRRWMRTNRARLKRGQTKDKSGLSKVNDSKMARLEAHGDKLERKEKCSHMLSIWKNVGSCIESSCWKTRVYRHGSKSGIITLLCIVL